MKNFYSFFSLSLLVIIFISCIEEEKIEPIITPQTSVFTSKEDVRNLISGEVVGTSTVNRFEDEISVSLEASNLIRGHVYNLVITTIDKPEKCLATPCTVGDFNSRGLSIKSIGFRPDGLVAAASSLNFNITIKEKDVTTHPFFIEQSNNYGGLQDALKAEVHLAIRSHGPAITTRLEEQRTSWATCTTTWNFGDSKAKIPMEVGECGWILQSSHLPPQ